ncbi:uncharacterized protein H6S33_004310 [Morchella sextelata]|uniref:uncharacterized protein n=1 Tax=Morchella sextelata TaxID=1174677 RepID=UPI001D051F27|nr:uncharacterized protein H6S33_004310 [Morchella sextelata]KAH0605853.1 hypothetical protein H6S33_004310 [Morchella sextelata]
MSTAGSHKDLELKEHGSEADLENKETSLMKSEMESDDPEVQAKAIAKRMSLIVDTALDRLKPFLEMMVESVERAERKKQNEQEVDEQELVDQVKPLLERSTTILQECYGAIKALDPDGKIANNAQNRAKNSEASAEEQHLAQGLATLAGDVTKTIERIKEFIKDMPHAKNQLGPLLDLFGEPLFQILSAVGLLLNGVLGLVAGILDGLGLGGIIRGLLNGLGLSKLLKGLGLGTWLEEKPKKS